MDRISKPEIVGWNRSRGYNSSLLLLALLLMLITLFDAMTPCWCVIRLETALTVGRLRELSVWEGTNFRAVFVVGHIWTWRPGRTYSSTESVQRRGIARATYWKNPGRGMKPAGHNRCCVRRRCEYWLFTSDCPETPSWPLAYL